MHECPIVAPSPISQVRCSGVCSTEPSCTLAPGPHHDAAEVGTQHDAVPDRGVLLDRDVADQAGGGGDERGRVDARGLALELVQRHARHPRSTTCRAPRAPSTRRRRRPRRASSRLSTLLVAVRGSDSSEPHEPRAGTWCRGRAGRRGSASKPAGVSGSDEHERGDELVARRRVGHGVHRGLGRSRGAAAGSARPVPPRGSRRRRAASRPCGRRSRRSRPRRGRRGRRSSTCRRASARPSPPRVVVVAGELPGAGGVDQLAGGLVEVGDPARRRRSSARGHSSPVAGSSTATPSSGRPSDPGGVPGTRVTTTAFSVEPKPSTTVHPNRRENALDVAVAGLVAEGDPQRVVGVVGPLGRGHHVGERLADVVRGTSRRSGARRRAAGEAENRSASAIARRRMRGPDPSRPSRRWSGTAASRRSRRRRRPRPKRSARYGAREGDLLVRDPDRLRLAARARGEDQHEQASRRRRRRPAASVRCRRHRGRARRRRRCRSRGDAVEAARAAARSRGSASTTWQSALRTSAASDCAAAGGVQPDQRRGRRARPRRAGTPSPGCCPSARRRAAAGPGRGGRAARAARRAASATYSGQVQRASPAQQRRAGRRRRGRAAPRGWSRHRSGVTSRGARGSRRSARAWSVAPPSRNSAAWPR